MRCFLEAKKQLTIKEMKENLKKAYSILALIVLFIGSILGSFSSVMGTSASASEASYIDVSPTNEKGAVKGSPVITAIPTPGKPVTKVTFSAKAKNEPDANFYPYAPDSQAPYTWSWPTGDPWVPDGEYTLRMVIDFSSGEVETVTREITVDNYSEPNAPVSPVELTATTRTSSSVTLSWPASTAQKIFDYVIYQNGVQVAATTAKTFTVENLSAETLYQFRVKTRDIYNNVSNDDNSINLLVPSDIGSIDPLPTISTIQATGPKGATPGGNGYSGDVNLSVTATDDNPIGKVEFFVKVLGAPEQDYWKFPTTKKDGDTYSVNWASIYTPEGNAIIKAVAYDSAGQSKTVTNVFLIDNVSDGGSQEPTWEPADNPSSNRIIGYLAGWSTYGAFDILRDLDASRLTHLNYAFALIGTDLKIKMSDPVQDPKNFIELAKVKGKYPHLKTIIAVGGFGGSANFIEAATTDQSREIFANSAVKFMVNHGFDGVDLDWEYPVTGGGPGTYPNPADRENFPLLLKKLREKLDEQGTKDGKHYILSIAGGATAGFANNTQLGLSQQYLDYVQIMTYDIHGTWETRADFNAPLFDDNGKTYSVDRGIKAYLNVGVPKDKLVMGVPFYGYKYNVNSSENNGLRQTFSGSGSITYNRFVKDDLLANGYERFWNEGSKVPYLYNAKEQIFISYDDTESMKIKAEYIRDNQLGGAMIWEISQDHSNDLLSTIYDVLKDPFVDNTAPKTTAELTGEDWIAGTKLGQATVTLVAQDNLSGVEKTEYRLNEGEWQTYTGPILVVTNGTTRVDYRSVDKVGNIEVFSSVNVSITAVSFNNLYQLIDQSEIHHGQRTALTAHVRQAEKANTVEKRQEKLGQVLEFIDQIADKHIDATARQNIKAFVQHLLEK